MSFELVFFVEEHKMESWVMNQIVARSTSLHTLKLIDLRYLNEENRTCIFEFVAGICQFSECLKTLALIDTGSTVE